MDVLMATTKDAILRKIQDLGEGAVFTPKDLLDVASRGMVDMTLKTLAADGTLRRLGRGLYDRPKISALLKGPLSPDVDAVAQAFARRFGWHVVPSGAHAANLLGLSTQVPAKAVYLSDGPSKTVKLGNRELIFKHARPKDLGRDGESPTSALFIQALRHLGRASVGPETIAALRDRLPEPARRALPRDTRYASDWIYAAAKAVAREGERP
jgi:hypothetical protein